MDNLDVMQVPIISLLSSSSNNTSSGQSALPKTINKIVRKKLYKRTTTRASPNSSSLRRSSSSKPSPPRRSRRHRWRSLCYKDGARSSLRGIFSRRNSRKASSSTDTTPSSTRSSLVDKANGSTSPNSSTRVQFSTPNGGSPNTPQSAQNMTIIESDDDHDDESPDPIRDSPSYGRQSNRRDVSFGTTIPASSPSSLYPELPTETPTNFVPYHPKTRDDTTTDDRLIHKLRKGPKGEVRNGKLAHVYTASMEGETGYVKIGWAEDIEKRIAELNSPRQRGTIHNEADTTPGAQSKFMNAFYAEQIIHLELYNSRRLAVERNETEWFEIPTKEAHEVCRKWRDWFILCEPYDDKQQLKEFWRQRMDRMSTRDPYNPNKHARLHERWTTFLNPSWWDKTSYQIQVTWRTICSWWVWISQNYPIILTLIGIIFWSSYGVVSFLLCISGVLVMWAGLSRVTNEEGRS
ncbi:hypothetical protein TMatcc_010839 [Talaromyces marneffei ATCC 18224]